MFREVKIEWTQQLVALQQQKTERIRKETILQNAKLDAQRLKDVKPHIFICLDIKGLSSKYLW